MSEEINDIVKAKATLRKEMLSKRAFMNRSAKKDYDKKICDELWRMIDKENYQVIHGYLPMGTEININPLLEKLLETGRTVVTPKTLPKRKLQNLVLNSLNEIEQGVFGTSHPANTHEYKGAYDLIIIPGLAFDKNNYRLGYGAGYYDNFLIHQPDALKVGIFYPFQEVESVPREEHDVRLEEILFFDRDLVKTD